MEMSQNQQVTPQDLTLIIGELFIKLRVRDALIEQLQESNQELHRELSSFKEEREPVKGGKDA
jgi:hypothetical protein